MAKEKGLEPLALYILAQEDENAYPIDLAADYVDAEKGVETPEDALQGALDIIAEVCSDNPDIRKRLFNLVWLNGVVKSVATDEQAESVYTGYYEFSEAVKKISGHRILAINRGEREEFLKVSVEISDENGQGRSYIVRHRGDQLGVSRPRRSLCLQRLHYCASHIFHVIG